MADAFNSLIDKVNTGLNDFNQMIQTLTNRLKDGEFEFKNVI